MIQLIPIALIAWFPIAVILFSKMPARKAVMVGALAATMFLPMGALELPFVPFNKVVITNLGLLIGALLMSPAQLMAFRLRLVDLPMVILIFVPYASATANGMSPYDAFAATSASFLTWGVPYLLGRAYLTDLYALRDAAQTIFVAALIYVPFCVAEMIMMPVLHQKVYGIPAHPDFMQGYRFGSWRPIVFMQHGLQTSLFMCCGALCGLWLWRNKVLRSVKKLPLWLSVFLLLGVAVACKSTGAIILMSVSMAMLFLMMWTRNSIFVYLLVLVTPIYIGARSFGGWQGEDAVRLATEYISPESGASLQTRFDNENVLISRAMTKAMLGWGPKDDYLIKDAEGRITSIPDGLWDIQLGTTGLVGLFALFGSMLAPTIALLRRFPTKMWLHPAMAAPAALAVFGAAYAIDCLMNAMINPVYVVAMGGVASMAVVANPLPRPASAGAANGNSGAPRQANRPPTWPQVPARPAGLVGQQPARLP